MGEECPTCHRTTDFGAEVYDRLAKTSFFTKLAEGIKANTTGMPPTTDELQKTINDAIKGIKFEPQIKVTHHGLQDALKCTNCRPEFDNYVGQQVSVALARQREMMEPLTVRAKKDTALADSMFPPKANESKPQAVFSFQ